MSESPATGPVSSVTSVRPVSPESRPPSTVTTTLVEINKMRNALLKLVDHYDAVAAELRRQNIPVKKSWEAHHAVAKARLERLVSLHERANHEELSLELGESKLSMEQIRRLHTEVDSLAALLSTGLEALKADIAAMDAAAAGRGRRRR